ncbi:MAG TPA: energy transducer TonB [Thermoanaerobaculia bacterium]|jgi:protein TonB|nr:energy transducer TonB [Thermoanaerobaculia bacterium]
MRHRVLLAAAVFVLVVAAVAAFFMTRRAPTVEAHDSTRPPVVETSPTGAAPAEEPQAVAAAPELAPRRVEKKKPVIREKKADVLTEPIQISRVEPQLPAVARQYHLHGEVVLKAQISREGNVESVTLVRGTHPLLDGAAERAVALWKYRPATVNGRAVSAPLQVTVSFKEAGRA